MKRCNARSCILSPPLTSSCCLCSAAFAFVYAATVMGKAEGQKELWHGHVTAVTVAPEYRRLGVAKQLMDSLETVRRDECCCSVFEQQRPRFYLSELSFSG